MIPPATLPQHHHQEMYLTESQVYSILKMPYWSNDVTENVTKYHLYRGKFAATVYTVRFNLNANYDPSFVSRYLLAELQLRYTTNTSLLASFHYDLLLVDPKSTPKSYYIWRANSNRHSYDLAYETVFLVNDANIIRFCQEVTNMNVMDMDNNFPVSSSVIIDKPLSLVVTFC